MKVKILKIAALAVLCSMGFSACEQNAPQPSLSAKISALNYNSAELTITSENLASYSLLTVEADAETAVPSAAAVFEGGAKGSLSGAETVVGIDDLKPETAYKFYVAAADADNKVFEKVVILDAVTPKDLTPVLSAELVEAGAISITVSLASANLTKYAFVAFPAGESEAPAGDLVFANGKVGELEADGTTEVVVPGLLPEKEFDVYFAAADAEDNVFETVVKLTATTGKCTDEVTIYAIGKNSATVTVNVPESVKAQGHVIKWAYQSLPLFISNLEYGPDAMNLANSDYFEMYFDEPTTFSVCDETSYIYEDGIPVDIKYYAPIPGEPGVLSLGEFAYDETGEYDYNFYWEPGYYIPMFDYDSYFAALWGGSDDPWLLSTRSGSVEENFDESQYWTGFYHRYYIQFEQPDELDAQIDITETLKANGGVINVKPSDNVVRCCASIIDDDTYNYVKDDYLAGNENLYQWLVSSAFALYSIGSFELQGETDLVLEDLIWASPGQHYHLLIAAHGDEEALTQKYVHHEFVIPDPSHPVPTTEAKQIASSDSVYEIAFNVKCPTGDAAEAKYACNYENEFQMALNSYKGEDDPLAAMLDSYGNSFSEEDIQKINSSEGLDLSFSTREDAVSMFGVVFYNDEGVAGNSVLITVKTEAETVEKVESPLFASLQGDWTAKATVRYTYTDYSDPDSIWGTQVTATEEQVCKVSFGDVSYPETLSDEVYDIYFNNTPYTTKEAVDQLYGQFKSYADEFNARVRARNRILANGYNFYYLQYEGSTSPLVYASAYDLFTDLNYSSATVEAPVMDFGPKWYLEVAKDGTVCAPFSREYMYSALSFKYNTFIFGAYDAENYVSIYESLDPDNSKYASFPVEVSEDGNTITIKALEVNGVKYYPNMLVDSNYSLPYVTYPVITEVVLTRGYTEEPVATAVGSAKKADYQPASHPGRGVRTPMGVRKASDAKKLEVKPVTLSELKANVKKYGEEQKAKRSSK